MSQDGVTRLVVKRTVDIDAMLAGAFRPFFEDVMLILYNDAVEWAPVQQKQKGSSGRGNKQSGGLLRSSIAPGRGVTTFGAGYAKVGSSLTRPGGDVPYGLYLDDPDRTGKYHYRSGPHQGQVTTGWLTGSIDRKERDVNDALSELASGIEAGWKRG